MGWGWIAGPYGAAAEWASDHLGSFGPGERTQIDPNVGRLPEADRLRQQMYAGLDSVQGRQAPQAAGAYLGRFNAGQQGQFRDRQVALANRLSAIGSGQQQGAGELAVQRQGNRAVAQQQAMARMGRGANAAMAARGAARNAGEIGLNVAGQSQQAALQDQQAALGQLGSVLGTSRGQDMGVAQMAQQHQFQQAGLTQQTNLANLDAQLRARGMDDMARQAYLAQLLGVSQAEQQGGLARAGVDVSNYDPGWGREFLGGLMQAGAAYAMSSDRNAKKDVREVSSQIDDMLEKLEAKAYRYKDPRHGEGRRAGIMAQDLERSEAGRRIVRDTPDGKMVDINAGLSAALASVARLHKRMKKLEGKGG